MLLLVDFRPPSAQGLPAAPMGCAAAREKAGLGPDGEEGGAEGNSELKSNKQQHRRLMEEDSEAEAAMAAAMDNDNDSLEGDTPGEDRELQVYKSRSTLAILRGDPAIDNPHSEGNRFINSTML